MSAVTPEEENLVRLAVIGCGSLSTKRIFPCFPRLPVRLVGVCDLDEAKARQNARRHGGEAVYSDALKMLDETKPDGLVVCIGPEMHAKLAKEALARGIPVYTEKPPAPTATEAWAVAQAARKAGKLCMTAFKYRYAPAQAKARAIIQSPEFGGLSNLSIVRASGPYKNLPGNARTEFLLDFCIHPIDQTLFLAGDLDEVFAVAPTMDNYAISVRFASGAVGSLAFSCRGSWSQPLDRAEIFGAAGQQIQLVDQIFLRYHADGVNKQTNEPRFCTAGGDSLVETGFFPEVEAFVAHLQGKRPVEQIPSRIEESVKSLAFYEAIKASAASGKPVKPARFE
ncbi:MAG: Gfo/Idh/MocA family oxidoreductase [Planctomycetota bacterium]|nr:Gfo/Idh/MocA family oxidoreductase [Planctomycetota bacterium]